MCVEIVLKWSLTASFIVLGFLHSFRLQSSTFSIKLVSEIEQQPEGMTQGGYKASKREIHANVSQKRPQSCQSTSDLRPESIRPFWQSVYLKFSLPLENEADEALVKQRLGRRSQQAKMISEDREAEDTLLPLTLFLSVLAPTNRNTRERCKKDMAGQRIEELNLVNIFVIPQVQYTPQYSLVIIRLIISVMLQLYKTSIWIDIFQNEPRCTWDRKYVGKMKRKYLLGTEEEVECFYSFVIQFKRTFNTVILVSTGSFPDLIAITQ